ncbi:hypothetical protein DL769_001961 [Monosporascus sp. CRB-8-3]|nr:hypothetical protein DL769_001961 [Monosporascus sp. CRB-8-3]
MSNGARHSKLNARAIGGFPLLNDGMPAESGLPDPAAACQVSVALNQAWNRRDLQSFSASHDVRTSSIFNAAWAITLGRYIGSDSVDFVTISSAPGCRKGVLCRTHLDRDAKLGDILRAVDACKPSGVDATETDQAPASSAVVFQAHGDEPLPRDVLNDITTYERFVSLDIAESESRISVSLSYSSTFMAEAQARNVAETFSQAATGLLLDTQSPLGRTLLISPHQLARIRSWNARFPVKADERLLHDLIDHQADVSPDALAIWAHDESFTHAELRALSNRLAHHLVALGVQPGTTVPYCFEKSAWTVVAMVAIAKAGGAMVAIDPKQPKLRTTEIISRVGASLMLTSQSQAELWREVVPTVFCVDQQTTSVLPSQQAPPDSPVTPSDALYIVFTSGSTGKPKGVVVEHRNIVPALMAMCDKLKWDTSSRVLQTAPYTFDASMLEILGALVTGACIYNPGEDQLRRGLTSVINEFGISFSLLTPSMARLLDPTAVPSLRTLVLGGEALSGRDTATWADRLCLINGYGPTECCIGCVANIGLSSTSNPANIGRAVEPGCTTWVVDADDHNRLVPIGAIGELVIQGPIVARGYYNDACKTEEVFIENPKFLQGDALAQYRLYKTGDLVRYNSDGTIFFIGRKDTQVKVHGQRIELSEIEHNLATDARIRHVAVQLPRHGLCGGNLVAALELQALEPGEPNGEVALLPRPYRQEAAKLVAGIKERLSARLPGYMVPPFWAVLHSMPTTISGKTDRQRLVTWLECMSQEMFLEVAGVDLDAAPEKPASVMERQIQEVWAEVLHAPAANVTLNRSFISLGGDSITALQVGVRCRSRGILMTVPDLLQSASLKEAAEKARLVVNGEHLGPARAESGTARTADRICKILASVDLAGLGLPESATVEAAVEDAFGCTPMQEGILLAQAHNPGAYQIRQLFRGVFRGSFPTAAASAGASLVHVPNRLRAAWQRVVEYHQALRTVFVDSASSDGAAFHQIVLSPDAARALGPDVRVLAYDGVLPPNDENVMGFVMGQPLRIPQFGPQVALTICLLPAGAYDAAGASPPQPSFFCMLEINHALIDGGSCEILLDDLAKAYDGLLTEPRGPLYRDLVTHIGFQSESEITDYWEARLTGASPCIVPVYGGDAGRDVSESRIHQVSFDRGADLLAFCRSHNFTVANVLQTAWALVLRTWAGTEDVMFGYITSGRDVPVLGIDRLVGACVNMVLCRLQIKALDTVRELVQRMRTEYFESLPHQHLSLARLQNATNLSGMPLFNSILSVERRMVGKQAGENTSITFEAAGYTDPSDFELVVTAEVYDDSVRIGLAYRPAMASDDEIANIANSFSAAISTVMTALDARAKDVSLFNERDHRLIWGWNQNEPVGIENCIHEEFARVASRTPQAPAICSWDGEFTYHEVDDLTIRLAHHLVASGGRPGMKVPFCFSKSAWATITELAILRIGAAAVGVSPTDPESRLQHIVEDCGADFVITQPQHAAMFEPMVDKVIIVESPLILALSKIPAYATSSALPRVTSTDLAFVCFTSGSTGKPKGVQIQHGSLFTQFRAASDRFHFTPQDRTLQFSAYTFDAHIQDTLFVLATGGCICVPSEEERTGDLAGVIRRMNVNYSFLTPQVSRVLRPDIVPSLKKIQLGGEAVNAETIRPWLGSAEVYIGYGPTETTLCCCATDALTATSDPRNIGRAMGSRLWITDAENPDVLVPVGAVGELLVEGRMVSEGYINRPEEQKAAFIESPLWMAAAIAPGAPPRRFYRTGDLVRYNPDGSINYIGRKDTQVKVRGVRIELGEIEHAIHDVLDDAVCSHASVDAVKLPKTGQALTAFLHIVPPASGNEGAQSRSLFREMTPELKSTFTSLQNTLTTLVPSYMVPSLFVPLGHVPLGTTGKVERKLLRAAVAALSDEQLAAYSLADSGKIAPITPLGLKLQALWANLLKRDSSTVGVQDSFFRLGGDSIAAMHLAAALRDAGLLLHIADIFRYPILQDMAEHVKVIDSNPSNTTIEPFSLLNAFSDRGRIIHDAAAACGVAVEDVEDVYPCTPLQEGLVAISTRMPGAYVLQSPFQLPSTIDMTRFRDAWQQVVDSSAILRTRIVLTSALDAVQVVLRPHPLEWRTESATLNDYLARERATLINYGQSLNRYTIVGSGSTRYFVWSAHHATYDGWSLPRLFDCVANIYNGKANSPLSQTPFNKFIQHIQVSGSGTEAEAFWEQQAKGEAPAIFPRLPSATYEPQADALLTHQFHIEHHSPSDITTSNVLRAAWALVLARYLENADDVVFGQTLYGRNIPVSNVDDMLGPTMTTVPIRVRIDRTLRVVDFLQAVQAQSIEMTPFEHFGLRNIRAIRPGGVALTDFQSLLVVRTPGDGNPGTMKFLGMQPLQIQQANFDTYALVMECTAVEGGTSLAFQAAYDSHVLPESRIKILMHHFEHVFLQLQAKPDVTLGQVDLFSAEDEKQVWIWNSVLPEAEADCVHEAVARQVALRPNDIAIDSWDGQLTYAELDRLASRLAHHFAKEYGIKPEILVPICLDKSIWTVVAMLAVLKAGGGYVMLNPDHPVARLRDIIAQTEARAVMTAPHHRHLFDGVPSRIVSIDGDFIQALPATTIHKVEVSPDNVAVVVFTSGSTGKSKGITIQHGNICTVAAQHCPQLGFREGMRVLQFAHFAFDMSNAEIFCVLMYGGTVCVATEEDRVNRLGSVVRSMGIDWLLLTPTVAGLLDPGDCPDLKTLVLIGEAVNQSVVSRWSGRVKLINSYGPAECTMWTSHALSGPGVSASNIGCGFGARLWIAEPQDHNRLTPVGCVGELLIEGPIVARGYLHLPEQTAAAFVDNPAWLHKKSPPSRVYKTGDLVRYVPDGTVSFVGRKDSQVKLHGQRIELGEIEHNVHILESVEASMVLLPESGPCKGRLVAVLALKEFRPAMVEGSDIELLQEEYKTRAHETLSEARAQIADRLPPYMVPSLWVVLSSVPVTPSRKINRPAITQFIRSIDDDTYSSLMGDAHDTSYGMPANDTESKINQIWSQVLSLSPEHVGTNRSFIGLGGDSITAMQVVSRCRTQHGLNVSVKDILRSKGVAMLATRARVNGDVTIVENKPQPNTQFPLLRAAGDASLEKLTDDVLPNMGVAVDNVQNIYPCSPIQEGILLSQARNPDTYLVRQVWHVQTPTAREPVDVGRLQAAWQSVIDRHSMLRTIFVENAPDDGSHFLQVVLKHAAANIKLLTHDSNLVVSFMEQQPRVQLGTSSPAHQMIICQTPDDEVYCLLELSHALIDGTSLALLQNDLILAYDHSALAMPGPLYSDYISYLQDQPKEAALAYWTKYLSSVVPCQFPSLCDLLPETRKACSLSLDLGAESALHAFCEVHQVTLANLFQAAWALVLRAYTGSDQVTFGYIASGRDIPVNDVAIAVGPFINTLICGVDLEGLNGVAVLKKVQEDYLSALPFQHTSLAKIQSSLGVPGQRLFNTLMSLQRLPPHTSQQLPLVFDMKSGLDPIDYDIGLQITSGAGSVTLDLSYWNSCLTDPQAELIANAFRCAVKALVAAPETTVEHLDFFSEQDERKILEWNAELPPPATELCLHWLVERQAELIPQAPAICSWDAELTFSELNDLSNRLASHLVSLGVGPEDLVPLCFDKSAYAVVAMLAVMKAGGGHVMISPEDPIQRVEALVADTEATVVLTMASLANQFTDALPGIHVQGVDALFLSNLPVVSGVVCSAVKPTNTAYVVFTSGSTGKPKGIVMEHQSFSTVCVQHAPSWGYGPSTRTLQFSAYTWDVSIGDIHFTLANGGCVCIPSEEERSGDIPGAVRRTRANHVVFTPTVSKLLNPVDLPSLRSVSFIGEAVPASEMRRWQEHTENVFMTYGPSECGVQTTWGRRPRDASIAATNIGSGFGTRLWIVNPSNHDQLFPVGAIGELLIEGPIVSRGYLNPQKTAESFIVNPGWMKNITAAFQKETRLYKTGDLVRYNMDGSLTFIGRKDAQVKINGQRTELSEIESQIQTLVRETRIPYSSSVVDVIQPTVRNEKKILAVFLTADVGGSEETSECKAIMLSSDAEYAFKTLQTALGRVLPQYMVDRKVLRNIGRTMTEGELASYALRQVKATHQTPLTEDEKVLCKLWAQVLDLGESNDTIDREDNFFRLGGESLAAMKLAAALRAAGRLMSVAKIYANPTLGQMAEAIRATSEQRQTVIKPFSLLPPNDVESLTALSASQCGVDKKRIQDIYPCTPVQEAVIAMSTRDGTAYISRTVFRLPEALDIPRYQGAWMALASAHPILRTRIINTGSGSLQVVLREDITWQHTTRSVEEYVEEDRALPMGYGTALVRYAIIQPTSEDPSAYFVRTAHHAIYDGWSSAMLFGQVDRYYREASLPVSSTAFNSFINYLENDIDMNAADAFWRTQVAGDMPSSFPKLPSPRYRPQPTAFQQRTTSISRKAGSSLTLSTVVRAAWAAVLGRWTDSDDVVFGLTLSGRNASVPGINTMLGPTISTVPVRVRLGAAMSRSIAAFLEQMHEQAVNMMPFEHAGLQRIRRLGASAAAVCDFQNLLVIQPAIGDTGEHLGLEPVQVSVDDAYPLVVECEIAADQVAVSMRYDSNVLSDGEVRWLLAHFDAAMLHMNEASTEESLRNLAMFSEQDRRQLRAWHPGYPRTAGECVHELVQAQVARRPRQEAVHAWDAQLSYEDLDNLSSRLASHLHAVGVGPRVVVPLCFDKSAWAIVAMLAVMKAGGAIVSLDPKHPISRLREIIDDCKANIILAAPHLVQIFKDSPQKAIPIAATSTLLGSGSSRVKPTGACPADPVFVVMTSGSTGKPKGIILEHHSLSASIRAHGPPLHIENCRALQFAAFTFDACISEIFTTLAFGGTVCVPSEEDRMSDLAGVINSMNVNWAFLTPTVANLIRPAEVPGLKTLVLIGEAPTQSILDIWSDAVLLINGYGPTECSVLCAVVPFDKSKAPTNLGRGVGAQLWITEIDNPDRLAPLGCVGELLVDGPIVGRGYLNSPERTAYAFIGGMSWLRDFGGSPEAHRLYRTGDLARYNADGTIDYLGRKDTQVKLYGQRIEMGEVEFHIKRERPTWKDIAVEVVPLREKKSLVAFFVPDGAEDVDNSTTVKNILSPSDRMDLRSLQDNLLSVMAPFKIPSMFVPLHRLPTRSSGKVDRRALRAALLEVPDNELEQYSLANATKRAPSTAAEQTLATLWAQVLDIPVANVGIDDTFFQLGGDSVSAMRLIGVARARGAVLSVADIFRHPRLVDLATLILIRDGAELSISKAIPPTQSRQVVVPGMPEADHVAFLNDVVCPKTCVDITNIQAVLPTTDIQALAIAGSLSEARWMLNYFWFESSGPIDLDRIEKACQETVNQLEILRTVFILYNVEYLQVVLKKTRPKFSLYETEQDLDVFTNTLIQADQREYLRLGEQLTRFYLVKAKQSNQHRIIMRISHAQYDGVSLPSIWSTYRSAYEGRSHDESTGFSNFVLDQYLASQTEGYRYWRGLLAGSFMTDVVARTGPPLRGATDAVAHVNRTISYAPLKAHDITFATMLKAAWAMVLSQYSGRSDIVFGHTMSGRSSGAADVVGPCINVVPVRVPLQPDWTGLDLLRFVQEQQLATLPHELVGFRGILKRCTDWAGHGYFGSVVQHQNIERVAAMSLDGYAYEPGFAGAELDLADLAVLTTPQPGTDHSIEVRVIYTPATVPDALAGDLLAALCATLARLSTRPSDPIQTSPPSGAPILPLDPPYRSLGGSVSSNEDGDRSTPESNQTMVASLTMLDETRDVKLRLILKNAWAAILGGTQGAPGSVPSILPTSSFFGLGGDYIDATKLALMLRDTGYQVAPEELVQNPTFELQMLLLGTMIAS